MKLQKRKKKGRDLSTGENIWEYLQNLSWEKRNKMSKTMKKHKREREEKGVKK